MSLPHVSIVVPARRMDDRVTACVRALLDQDYPSDRVDVIVVDNRRPGRTVGAHTFAFAKGPVRVVREARTGAAAARNAGIRAARHELVACIDADCLADPGWLRALVDALQPGVDLVGGRVIGLQSGTPIERFLDTLYDQQASIERFRPPYVISCSLLARRSTFMDLGLFDERLLRGQDVELSYRGHLDGGLRLVYAPASVARHAHDPSFRALLRKGYDHGRAAGHVWWMYAPELGFPVRRKLFDRRPWARLLGTLVSVGRPPSGSDDEQARLAAWFGAARQFGFVASVGRAALSLRTRLRRTGRPRSECVLA